VVGSGMAAISLAILGFAGAGDHIVAADSLYGGTLAPDAGAPAARYRDHVRAAIPEDWAAGHPAQHAAPVPGGPRQPNAPRAGPAPVVRLARERGLPVIVDATFATPVNFRPIEHGVDVVVHSGTKYLGGHSDLVAGVWPEAAVVETARERLKSFGPSLDPHAVWLLDRGLKTLALRVDRQNRSALELARWLAEHPAVVRVHYPGLEDHPDHAVAAALCGGFGGMLSFVVRGRRRGGARGAGAASGSWP
jgi:cystathionine beta-lyase/cystathionine gamma-synthase